MESANDKVESVAQDQGIEQHSQASNENKELTNQDTKTLENSTTIEKHSQKRIFKIIVIGDSNVGKTCLTFRFCSGKFPDKTEATIGVDFRERTVDINNETIKLQLWDTAGQERFRKSMVQHYYRNVHAVVFVYDVTKMSSFENMPVWIDECDRHNLTADVPRLLVGNKCDEKGKAVVHTHVAQKFADSHSMPLFETSAKDDSQCDHVDAIFLTLAHKLQNSKPMMSPVLGLVGSGHHGMERAKVISVGRSKEGIGLQPIQIHESKKDKCNC